ncbi:MAG: hypothetical protein HRJ53_08470, partial [Acidobacteria bacterium Pan2503]|nr:hypothetical protein [Candidatus Acidoferrum panamensis]
MGTVGRLRVEWHGLPGGTGLSTFYVDAIGSATLMMTSVAAFFTAIKGIVPPAVQWVFPSQLDSIDDATGKLLSSQPVTPNAAISGLGGSNYAATTGILVKWATGGVVDGHRVVGKTFIVPIESTDMTSNGGPSSSSLTTVSNAANNYITAMGTHAVVWSRPFAGRPAVGSLPPIPARAGSQWPIQAA